MRLETVHDASGVSLLVDGRTIRFSTEDDHSKKWFAGNCAGGRVHEEPVTRRVLGHLEDAPGFADVGAHLGWFTCLAAAFGAATHSFEANPRLVPLITRNLELNALQSKAAVHHCAVADRQGTIEFPADTMKPGQSMGRGALRVPTLALDDHFQGRQGVPSLFKIDVEGAEARVLRGMSGILEKHRPTLLLEIHPAKLAQLGSSRTEVEQLLARFGYAWESVATSGANPIVWATSPRIAPAAADSRTPFD